MAAPFSMVDSKLERAIVAYLISAGAGTAGDVFHSMSPTTPRSYPNTTILPVNGTPEPKFTGNYRVQIWVSIKGSAAGAVDATDPRIGELAFRQRVQQTFDALMQADDDQTLRFTAAAITTAGRALATDPNDADMVDFTCQEWEDAGFGQGKADGPGCSWERVLMFSAIACSANVD